MQRVENRNDVIDAFRGFAILAVLAFHYTVRWPHLTGFDRTFDPILSIGAYGVHVFFVISGLVITMTVVRSGDTLDFIASRISRLLPALLFAATVTFAVCQYGPAEFRRTWADYFASLTFVPEFFGRNAVDGAYWSLSVEVRFYAIVALMLFALKTRFWIGVLAVAVASGFARILDIGESILFAEYWPYFLFGMAGWFGLFERRFGPAAVLGLVGAVLFLLAHPGGWADVFIIGSVAAMFALIALQTHLPIMPVVGRWSYSLYLIHQFLGVIAIAWLKSIGIGDCWAIAITVAAAFAFAALIYKYMERPGQKFLKSNYQRARSYFMMKFALPTTAGEDSSRTGNVDDQFLDSSSSTASRVQEARKRSS